MDAITGTDGNDLTKIILKMPLQCKLAGIISSTAVALIIIKTTAFDRSFVSKKTG